MQNSLGKEAEEMASKDDKLASRLEHLRNNAANLRIPPDGSLV